MEDNDDDYFSDDFDAFPPGTLYQLEQNAFQATQAPATQWQAQPSLRDEAGAAPPVQTSTSLKPPPRLHTGLTNDYDTMEMGELEAEVHDNLERPVALPPVGHFPIARTGRSANVDMGDAMDLDDDGSGHVNDMSVNLQQVGCLKQLVSCRRIANILPAERRKRTDATTAGRGQGAGGDESWRDCHHTLQTDQDD